MVNMNGREFKDMPLFCPFVDIVRDTLLRLVAGVSHLSNWVDSLIALATVSPKAQASCVLWKKLFPETVTTDPPVSGADTGKTCFIIADFVQIVALRYPC